jgi:hypothetical protein
MEPDTDYLMKFCDSLLSESDDPIQSDHPKKTFSVQQPIDDQPVPIQRHDIENLIHFVQIWTDVIDIDQVMSQFKASEFHDLHTFETENNLYNVGFFYVKVNKNLALLEFFGLLTKIPWDSLRSPGFNQIHYASLANIFSETVAIQLMVLGDCYKFWMLIDPYHQMTKTHESTKLLLSGSGSLSILISPKFIKDCQELIETVELNDKS